MVISSHLIPSLSQCLYTMTIGDLENFSSHPAECLLAVIDVSAVNDLTETAQRSSLPHTVYKERERAAASAYTRTPINTGCKRSGAVLIDLLRASVQEEIHSDSVALQ